MAVYGYTRVSTAKQAAEGESLEVQKRKIEGRAQELGKTLDHVYEERGISGGKLLGQRPEGRQLLARVTPGDIIIATRLDRMFRDVDDARAVLKRLKKQKVSLILLDLGGDVTGDGIAKLTFTILSAVAEMMRDQIGEQIAAVKADQRARGRYLGGALPFGYRRSPKGQLQPVPKQQRAIRVIKRLHAKKHSLREISQRLHRHDIELSHMGVAEVLRREQAKAEQKGRVT
jgi:putative DNA-invertase from lambdoid prophage Rac